MAYQGFAQYYDALNTDADYVKVAQKIANLLYNNQINSGIVADLGCGTGELAILLAEKGFDMLCVDASAEMLNVLKNKLLNSKKALEILLICQKLEELDLFGTVGAAISTFDTFNHLEPKALEKCIERISLFVEPGGMLIFDMNTPYKHQQILKNNTFIAQSLDYPGIECEWENKLISSKNATDIFVEIKKNNKILFYEHFREYYYNLKHLTALLEKHNFSLQSVCDGDTYLGLQQDSQRMLIAAKHN